MARIHIAPNRSARIDRVIEGVVDVFRRNPHLGDEVLDPRYLARWHYDRRPDQVTVYLRRAVGDTFSKIAKRYRIDLRTAQRWEAKGVGKNLIDSAVKAGKINPVKLVAILSGTEG